MDLTPLLGLKGMTDQASDFLRYGPDGSPWQNIEDAWYYADGSRGTDPSDPGGDETQPALATPPTDEEWAAVCRVAFEGDLEKVRRLVQIIAIFQSLEGAHAQSAEGDEEKSYVHMVVFGVIMAVLGAVALRLLPKCWEGSTGHERKGERKEERNEVVVRDEETTPRISTLRTSSGSTLVPHTTPRRRAGAAARAASAGGRRGPTREDLMRLQRLDPMESYLAERGGARQTFIEDQEGTRWREVYTYLDD